MRNKKKWVFLIVGVICLIGCLCLINVQKKPKLVSSITSLDTAYLTILVEQWFAGNKEETAKEIVEMCRQNAFTNIRLISEGKDYPRTLFISVYKTEKQMKRGSLWMSIKYVRKDESSAHNIASAPENYQLYIDGRLVKI